MMVIQTMVMAALTSAKLRQAGCEWEEEFQLSRHATFENLKTVRRANQLVIHNVKLELKDSRLTMTLYVNKTVLEETTGFRLMLKRLLL